MCSWAGASVLEWFCPFPGQEDQWVPCGSVGFAVVPVCGPGESDSQPGPA
jgi:hypothetical protein